MEFGLLYFCHDEKSDFIGIVILFHWNGVVLERWMFFTIPFIYNSPTNKPWIQIMMDGWGAFFPPQTKLTYGSNHTSSYNDHYILYCIMFMASVLLW